MSNENINHEVGKVISKQRKSRGLTLKALGQLAGTTGPQIHRLENGGTQVTMEWLERIASALGLKIHDLMPENQQASLAMAEYKAALIGTIQAGVIQPQPFKYIGDIAYPGMLGSQHAPELFAMTMGDSSFSRVYPAGTILLCEPMKTAMQMLIGDHVIIANVTEGGTELGLAILLADSGGAFRLALQDSLRETAPHTANMILSPNTSFTPTRVKNGAENSLKAAVSDPFQRQVLGVVRQTIRPR